MFSARLPWDLATNRLSTLLASKRSAGAPVLDLTESNPTAAGLPYPQDLILQSFADPAMLRYEPSAAGPLEARRVVASYYREAGREVAPADLFLTASTSESYAFLFKLLADPGDTVLVPRPSYPLFEFLAALESVRVEQYPLRYDGRWWMDLDALERMVTPRCRAVVLVNPNNPTGSFLKAHEMAELNALCSRHGLAIISDEVFSDYPLEEDPARVATLAGRTDVLSFSLGGLSKAAGLPQMKLGWMALSGPPRAVEQARTRLELIADTYLSVSTPVHRAFPGLLEAGRRVRAHISERTRQNLAWLRSALAGGSPAELIQVEGGWYVTLRVPRLLSEEEWCLALLEKDDVLVQPGFFYDFETEAYLVLSLLTPHQTFTAGVGRLLERISSIG